MIMVLLLLSIALLFVSAIFAVWVEALLWGRVAITAAVVIMLLLTLGGFIDYLIDSK